MSEGIWTMGLVDLGDGSSAMATYPPKDNFQRYTTTAPVGTAGVVVVAKPARMYMGTFANGSTTVAYYVQFFNRTTAPVNGLTPIWQVRLSAASNTSGTAELSLASINGITFTNGFTYAISTTPSTLTLATANDLAFASIIYTSTK